ncbi:predicted protein [Methanosarcina acetivorans C2A]|uniref:AB hydrolase-1 domain-containing protein n=2 Tax=Methanosarcina acetivorans TaxID=2214 RepID=Q8TL66_METAC|nr:predicted protein [Methanosarcina acetivorans C2A]
MIGENMKTRINLIVSFFVLLAVSSPVSAAVPDLQIGNIHTRLDKLGISYTSAPFTVSQACLPFTESSRIGPVSGNVVEYKIKVNVGPGEYDNITLTNYVREKRPWTTKADKNLVILPGHALTEEFYSDMAIYYAQQGYSTYILDRRETNVQADETDFSFMQDWTFEEYLQDTYKGINTSRSHTALLSGKSAENIEVTAIGHSHGAMLLTAYEASEYDDLPAGSVDRAVPVDIIIEYNPENSELIQNQMQEFASITESIENGVYADDSMAGMMYVACMASTEPEGYNFSELITNRQFFRLMASQTYSFSAYPYTPDYHYWSGNLSGLYYVDENRLLNLTLTGGAVPYAPKYLDQYMAGLMGNVEGYEINSSRIDSPVLYVGLGGGFGDYGAWWYENEVGNTNNRVTTISWNDQGHSSLLIDNNSSELWTLIDDWIDDNKSLNN